MAKTKVVGPPLAYDVKQVEGLTPYGYDSLMGFIKSGTLPARRAEGEKGPGKYVILHADLVAFLENLPAA